VACSGGLSLNATACVALSLVCFAHFSLLLLISAVPLEINMSNYLFHNTSPIAHHITDFSMSTDHCYGEHCCIRQPSAGYTFQKTVPSANGDIVAVDVGWDHTLSVHRNGQQGYREMSTLRRNVMAATDRQAGATLTTHSLTHSTSSPPAAIIAQAPATAHAAKPAVT